MGVANILRAQIYANVPWLLAPTNRADSTTNTANPSCRFPRCPSVHGSFHEPMCGTICPELARTARARTSRSSRPTALHSYRRHSRDKNRLVCLQVWVNMICILKALHSLSETTQTKTAKSGRMLEIAIIVLHWVAKPYKLRYHWSKRKFRWTTPETFCFLPMLQTAFQQQAHSTGLLYTNWNTNCASVQAIHTHSQLLRSNLHCDWSRTLHVHQYLASIT